MATLVSSGDWLWINGWVYAISLAMNIGIGFFIINKHNPRVLRNRTRLRAQGLTTDTRKYALADRLVLPLIGLCVLGIFGLSSLGHRFGWFTIPLSVSLVALAISNVGLIISTIALVQNPFASKILDISKEQQLVDVGLYGMVRHPFYSGFIAFLLFTPIALGSVWGLIPALIIIIVFVIRIHFEEAMLAKGMEGYTDYQSRVKYKIIPGIY